MKEPKFLTYEEWFKKRNKNCEECNNTGIVKCEECDGDGYYECEACCTELNCTNCGGVGEVKCEECGSIEAYNLEVEIDSKRWINYHKIIEEE